MSFHGNSKKNNKPHHLYEIKDEEERDIFKYGISDNPINEYGQSRRMTEQTSYLNRAVGWIRYLARIIKRNISTREEAIELEEWHVDEYRRKNGRNPRGNVRKTRRQMEEE